MTYTPYRILSEVVTVVEDSDDVIFCYPHGQVGDRSENTGKVAIHFVPGVIDAPTDEEKKLFDMPSLAQMVKPIPQDVRGFDQRLSGVARSIKGSQTGRERGIIEGHERKSRKKAKKPEVSEPEVEETEKEMKSSE